MHNLILTFMQRLQLTLVLRAQTGKRKDLKIRTLHELRKRLCIPVSDVDKYIRQHPMDQKSMIVDFPLVNQQPEQEFQVTSVEVTTLLECVNDLNLSSDDLELWADDLGNKLENLATIR